MDIVMAKVMRFTGWLLPLIWIAVVGCWGAALWLTQRRKQISAERVGKIMVVLVVAYLAPMFVSIWLLDHYTNQRLETFARGEMRSLHIAFEGRTMEMRDPAVIHELWSIICDARSVWAHHSGPVDCITLYVPEVGYRYSLGKDSKVADEYWLLWLSYPGSDPTLSSITKVKQFRSPVLGDWLRRHVLASLERKNKGKAQ